MKKLKEAIIRLKKDLVIGIPTETTYGLAASISNIEGIKKIFFLKQRPLKNPLIVHISSIEQLKNIAFFSSEEEKLMQSLWPGPLTLILKKKSSISPLITANQKTVAVRMPSHPLTLKLIEEVGPLVAPSANPYQKLSPTRAKDVRDYFSDLYVLDGGSCSLGVESTILKITPKFYTILRPGPYSKESLVKFLKNKKEINKILKTSGQDKNHYQPNVPLYIINKFQKGAIKLPKDPKKFLTKMYTYLKEKSLNNKSIFIVDNHLRDDLWKTIWDRLYKASSK